MNTVFSFSRLGALLAKEFIQMRRDRVTFAMMLGVPLMLLILFGFAINNDPKSLPAALLAMSNDQYTRAIVTALENTNYYRFDRVAETEAEADLLLARGDVAFVVTIPADFGTRVQRGDHPQILIEADATDPAAASGAISTLGTVAGQALLRAQGMQAAAEENAASRLDVVVHRLYNPEGISQYNIVPGLLTGGGTCPSGDNNCDSSELATWNLGTLTPGEDVTVTIPLQIRNGTTSGTLVVFDAEVRSDTGLEATAGDTAAVGTGSF